ncbi:MAG TPA: aspartyl protease family protein [Pirellulales bacterium]|nr:aspartyl protease family protein [Pirellulales bacterium]
MDKVLVAAKMENLFDLYQFETGSISAEQVRCVEVTDALIDTGETMVSMPKRFIDQLGLRPFRKRRILTSAGPGEAQVYDAVRLTVQGRDCTIEVSELPDECPVHIGLVPLGLLDFVVDPVGQRLIGNPAHGGEQMIELY